MGQDGKRQPDKRLGYGHFQTALSRVREEGHRAKRLIPAASWHGREALGLLSLGSACLSGVVCPSLLCDACCAPAVLGHWFPPRATLSHILSAHVVPTSSLLCPFPALLPAHLLPVPRSPLRCFFSGKSSLRAHTLH